MAIILSSQYKAEGIQFLTPSAYSQQLGYMNRPAGYKIQPHLHNVIARQVSLTQEVLIVKSGVVRVDFYSVNRIYLESAILSSGDIILLASGGHGFEILEDAEIVEVKQGPYSSDEDKIRFDGVDEEYIRINTMPDIS
ncbi:hypothetical protein [Polynucleobacter sp. AP-Kaivos-20-H2]|uniref:hypothetical protein n=1 Tax=Polynucleobacter sp. AP-Kaivos-20-H2 TaxID=2689104 RepID=UPI001C20D8A6|nr:hypothetical protein [Polynucleobacter sp. AP-Kaivos-20-H2]